MGPQLDPRSVSDCLMLESKRRKPESEGLMSLELGSKLREPESDGLKPLEPVVV